MSAPVHIDHDPMASPSLEIGSARLLSGVVAALQCLNREPDLDQGIIAALDCLHAQSLFQRIFVYRTEMIDGEPYNRLIHDAFSPGTGARSLRELDPKWAFHPEAEFLEVMTVLRRGEVWQSLVHGRTATNRQLNEAAGSQSDLIVPINVDGVYWGCVGFDSTRTHRFSEAEIEVLQGVSEAISSAVRRAVLAAEVTARESAHSAELRAAEYRHAHKVLRQLTEEIALLEHNDQFVPRVLQMAAATFGTHSAGFYEIDPTGTVRLRYWLKEGRILTPQQLIEEDPGQVVPTMLWHGFRVPDEYVGGETTVQRRNAVVIDHQAGSVVPLFDAWACHLGLPLELNVPCLVRDRAPAALCLYRAAGQPFTSLEVSLAELLSQQLALAMQASEFAAKIQEAAVSRERETAAILRAEYLDRTNATLRTSLDLLANESEVEHFLGHVLSSVARQLNSPHATLWLYDDTTGMNSMHMLFADDHLGPAPLLSGGLPLHFAADSWPPWQTLLAHRSPILFRNAPRHPDLAGFSNWIAQEKIQTMLTIPLVIGNEIQGTFCLHKSIDYQWSDDEMKLAQAMAHQATLALQISRLSERARRAALVEQRNHLAREIHDTLAQGFAAIAMQLQAASREAGFSAVPGPIQQYLATALELTGASLAEARRSIRNLRPSSASRPAFGDALAQSIDRARKISPCPIECTTPAQWPDLPTAVQDEILRIVQEALVNAVKHAQASQITVTGAVTTDQGIQFKVKDNGIGFEPTQTAVGFGLPGMEERARRIGADVTVIGEPLSGTEVIVVWNPGGVA